jgi:hypothetical protein
VEAALKAGIKIATFSAPNVMVIQEYPRLGYPDKERKQKITQCAGTTLFAD